MKKLITLTTVIAAIYTSFADDSVNFKWYLGSVEANVIANTLTLEGTGSVTNYPWSDMKLERLCIQEGIKIDNALLASLPRLKTINNLTIDNFNIIAGYLHPTFSKTEVSKDSNSARVSFRVRCSNDYHHKKWKYVKFSEAELDKTDTEITIPVQLDSKFGLFVIDATNATAQVNL